MDVFFDIANGSSFSIEVYYWDSVLDIKKRIKKYQGIPVSEQTLFSQEGSVLQDDLAINQTQIVDNSHLELVISSPSPPQPIGDLQNQQQTPPLNNSTEENDVPVVADGSRSQITQVPETEQSPSLPKVQERSNRKNDQTEKSQQMKSGEEFSRVQDLSVKAVRSNKKNDQTEKSQRMKSGVKDSPVKKWRSIKEIYQVTEKVKSPSSKKSAEEKDLPLTVESIRKNRNERSSQLDSVNKNDQVTETEQAPMSNSGGEELTQVKDSSAKVGTDQVTETEPVKMILINVLPPPGDNALTIRVCHKVSVKKLREDLVNAEQKGLLELPEGEYYFRHKGCAMDEDKTLFCYGVVPKDTIEIVLAPSGPAS